MRIAPAPGTETSGFAEVAGKRIAFVRHDAGDGSAIVVMAHGFKSSKSGPSRYFVPLARAIAGGGVSTFRFDQPGSGDSAGDFDDSSFNDWVANIAHFASAFASEGKRVALLGQSMGGAATMTATRELRGRIRGVALWSPAPMLDERPAPPGDGWMEEDGQRVRASFWREAAAIDFLGAYAALDVPAYVVFGTADEFISTNEMRRVEAASRLRPGDRVDVIEGLPHSAWPHDDRTRILRDTAAFLARVVTAPAL